MESVIKRDHHLRQLIDGRHNGLIKIVTGIHRCGKSYLLFRLFKEYLQGTGVSDTHIIEVAMDDLRMENMRNPRKMLQYVESRMTEEGPYHVLLDEVQLMDRFVEALNSLLHLRGVDIYVRFIRHSA